MSDTAYPYRCEDCGMTFHLWGLWASHGRSEHGRTVPKFGARSPFAAQSFAAHEVPKE